MRHVNMTITIPEDLRRKIREIKNVNWSEVARRAFEEEIKKLERLSAVEEIDRLRSRSEGWSGADEVRKWRDLR